MGTPPPKLPAPPEDTAELAPRLRDALDELLPAGLLGAFDRAFAAMAVAEEEIDAAKARYPERAAEIHQSFRFLSPSEILAKTSEDLYRHHARELLDRVGRGEKLEPGTDAELLAALSEISLAAPPSRPLTLLYMKLFSGLYPQKAEEFFDGITPDLYEEERMAELESELRRKLASERDCHAA